MDNIINTLIVPFCILLLSFLIGGGVIYSLSRKRLSKLHNDLLINAMLGFMVLSQIYCAIGMLGLLNRSLFIIIALILAIPGAYSFIKTLSGLNLKYVRIIEWRCRNNFVIFLLPALILGVNVSLLPPFNWDEISYGLTFPKLHIESGNFRYINEYGIFSAFPLFGETSVGIPLLLTNDPKVSHLTTFLFLPACISLLYRIAIQLKINTLLSWLVIISFSYLPLTLANIGTAKIEIYQLSYILLAFYFLLQSNEIDKYDSRLFSYLAIGFSGGIKYTTLFVIPFYLCLYIYKTPFKKGLTYHSQELAKLILFAFGINLVWLSINLINFCNPVFPNMTSVFGQCMKYPVTSDIMQMVMESTMLQEGTSWKTTESLSIFYDYYINAFGKINSITGFASLMVFSFVFLKKKNSDLIWLWCGLIITTFIQIFIIYWEFRYTYFIFPFFLIFILLINRNIINNLLVSLFVIIIFMYQAYLNFTDYIYRNPSIRLAIMGKISTEVFQEKFIHLYWISKWINENTPIDSKVAFNWGAQPFYYLNRRFLFLHDWNPEFNIQQITSHTELENVLNNSGVNYLVWRNQDDSRFRLPSKSVDFHVRMSRFVEHLVRNGQLVELYAHEDVRIYKFYVFN
jgi:hypothetical protein